MKTSLFSTKVEWEKERNMSYSLVGVMSNDCCEHPLFTANNSVVCRCEFWRVMCDNGIFIGSDFRIIL